MLTVRKILTFVLALTLVSCGISKNIKPGEKPELDETSSVLFLGITPAYRIHLLRGTVTNGIWERPIVDTPEVNITPDSGYIFVKVKPTTGEKRLGVSLVFPEGHIYGPCQDSIAPIFTLKPGTVSYVGDLRYFFNGKELSYDYIIDENKAKAFLRDNYPNFEAAMTTIPMEPMKVKSTLCDPKTITIPIYVPR